ncbi:helix-turn-helix domain-containing protein [Thermus antranikianii]
MTVEEVAKLLRVSRKTVEKLIYAKKLHAVKVGRVWRIPRAAVEAFLGGKEYREP